MKQKDSLKLELELDDVHKQALRDFNELLTLDLIHGLLPEKYHTTVDFYISEEILRIYSRLQKEM